MVLFEYQFVFMYKTEITNLQIIPKLSEVSYVLFCLLTINNLWKIYVLGKVPAW